MREMQNVSAFKQVSIHSPSRNKIEFIRNLTFGCFYFNLTLLIQITGFTLGQYGTKSMRAIKESMPQLPDDDDGGNEGDSQKNYATVSLCCLSVTNPFRNKIIQIVSVNPWFDRFILLVILVNCVFLALDKEIDSVTNNIETIDFVFLIIYTWEMTMKIIAMGFFMRAHSYLRDSWNIVSAFDFSEVNLMCLIDGFQCCGPWMDQSYDSKRRHFCN